MILAIAAIFIISKNQPSKSETHDYKDITYTIEGQQSTLKDGHSKYFGNELRHDLNNDGLEDVVFFMTRETGGSGTFFYVVAAINTGKGYIGSDAYSIGDRIAPQTINIDEGTTTNITDRDNVIVVNYADRAPGEPMNAKPTVGKSVWLKLDPETMKFGVVEKNFEGESK